MGTKLAPAGCLRAACVRPLASVTGRGHSPVEGGGAGLSVLVHYRVTKCNAHNIPLLADSRSHRWLTRLSASSQGRMTYTESVFSRAHDVYGTRTHHILASSAIANCVDACFCLSTPPWTMRRVSRIYAVVEDQMLRTIDIYRADKARRVLIFGKCFNVRHAFNPN